MYNCDDQSCLRNFDLTSLHFVQLSLEYYHNASHPHPWEDQFQGSNMCTYAHFTFKTIPKNFCTYVGDAAVGAAIELPALDRPPWPASPP